MSLPYAGVIIGGVEACIGDIIPCRPKAFQNIVI